MASYFRFIIIILAKYKWIHYDEVNDAAFYHICQRTLEEKKLKSTHKDPVNGFKNWKDGTIGLRKHKNSDCYMGNKLF